MAWFEDTFGNIGRPLDRAFGSNGLQGVLDPFDSFGLTINTLFGKPQGTDALVEEQKRLMEEEKKRKAEEANRLDLKASQAASSMFSQNGIKSSNMMNDFLGL